MRDQYDDSLRKQLYKLDNLIEFPIFVKSASESDPEEIKSLPSACFADQANRKFPVHTRQDAYLSRLYFSKNASEYKDVKYASLVGENLEKSAAFWKLDTEYVLKQKPMDKTASASYSIPIQDSAGGTIDRWVLNTPRDFEKAAIQIFENKNMFSFPQRSSVAKKMLQIPLRKEANLTPEVSEYLEKAAGYGMNTRENVLDVLMSRSVLYNMKNHEFGDRMAQLADKVASEEVTPNLLEKIATVIDICDRELHLSKHYNNGRMSSPEEELFIYTEKVANDIKSANIRLTNGKVMALDKLAEDKLNRYFEEYIGELPKCGYEEKINIVKSLPSPDADALVNFMEV